MRRKKTLEEYIEKYKKDMEHLKCILDYALYEAVHDNDEYDNSTYLYYLSQYTECVDIFCYLKELKKYRESKN